MNHNAAGNGVAPGTGYTVLLGFVEAVALLESDRVAGWNARPGLPEKRLVMMQHGKHAHQQQDSREECRGEPLLRTSLPAHQGHVASPFYFSTFGYYNER